MTCNLIMSVVFEISSVVHVHVQYTGSDGFDVSRTLSSYPTCAYWAFPSDLSVCLL